MNGIQISRVEPCHVILLTASPKLRNFESLTNQRRSMYDELFQWDQKLHVVNFRENKNLDRLLNFCLNTGGSFSNVKNFNDLRIRMQILAENCLFTV